MRFAHVTIAVKDMEESLHFYGDIIGLPEVRRLPSAPGREIVFLGNENESLVELIYNSAQADFSFGASLSIGFEVPSLDAMLEKLREEGIDPGPVSSPNPVMRMIFITDPNGVRVQFLEEKR